jgi:thymidylate synthase ThyX
MVTKDTALAGSRERLLSPEPEVRIAQAFQRSFDNMVATARTCYSANGIIHEDDVSGVENLPPETRERKRKRRDDLARDLYEAGHHTTLQHAHFQFTLNNVSRQFLWSFLHSHPFYNSEQVSQRYVEVKPGNYVVPPLAGEALALYQRTVQSQVAAYQEFCRTLVPLVEAEYYERFPARGKRREIYGKEVQKKAQEVARYVLPVATFAYLYHTISGLTLLRYYRMALQEDAPLEQRIVLEKMVQELLRLEPGYRVILQDPIAQEETVEYRALQAAGQGEDPERARRFAREFDAELGSFISKLVDAPAANEALLAQAVREVLGIPRGEMGDADAIAWVMDPSRNSYLGEALNLDTLSKVSRALYHARYTFRKRLSHTADSQNQRHRLTPASRPILIAHLTGDPDFATPGLIRRDPSIQKRYEEVMALSWEAIRRLRGMGVSGEFALYLLPNAANVRFTESADLLNLRHKHTMRLCYNAQEEIWQASWEEALQIREVNPRIGAYLLPPCTLRYQAGATPYCPEGRRYCGEPVWRLPIEDYRRAI